MAYSRTAGTGAGVAHDIGSSYKYAEYSSFGTEIDLIAASRIAGKMCRAIIVSDVGAGTKLLVVKDATGSTVTLTCTNLQAVILPIQAKAVTTSTTVARIVVLW